MIKWHIKHNTWPESRLSHLEFSLCVYNKIQFSDVLSVHGFQAWEPWCIVTSHNIAPVAMDFSVSLLSLVLYNRDFSNATWSPLSPGTGNTGWKNLMLWRYDVPLWNRYRHLRCIAWLFLTKIPVKCFYWALYMCTAFWTFFFR